MAAVSFALARPSSISTPSSHFGESRHREEYSNILCLICCDPLHRRLHVLFLKKVRKSIVLAGCVIAICNLRCSSVATPGAGADIRVQRENTNSSPFCRPPVDASVPFARGSNQHPLRVCRLPTLAGASVAPSSASFARRFDQRYPSCVASETRLFSGEAAPSLTSTWHPAPGTWLTLRTDLVRNLHLLTHPHLYSRQHNGMAPHLPSER